MCDDGCTHSGPLYKYAEKAQIFDVHENVLGDSHIFFFILFTIFVAWLSYDWQSSSGYVSRIVCSIFEDNLLRVSLFWSFCDSQV